MGKARDYDNPVITGFVCAILIIRSDFLMLAGQYMVVASMTIPAVCWHALFCVLLQWQVASGQETPIAVTVVSDTPLGVTETRYASWNIDPSCDRGFHTINFSNPNLVLAAAALSPSRLRFGGSGADALLYSFTPNDGVCDGLPPPGSPGDCHYFTPGCLNASHFSSLLGLLASNADGADHRNEFIFGLSFNLTDPHPWSSANAERLLSHVQWPSDTIWGFELGNELNNHPQLQPAQQVAALASLSRLLGPSGRIIGPDSGYTAAQAWDSSLLPQLRNAGVMLHAITHHVYLGLTPKDWAISTEALANKLDSPLAEIAWYSSWSLLFPTLLAYELGFNCIV